MVCVGVYSVVSCAIKHICDGLVISQNGVIIEAKLTANVLGDGRERPAPIALNTEVTVVHSSWSGSLCLS